MRLIFCFYIPPTTLNAYISFTEKKLLYLLVLSFIYYGWRATVFEDKPEIYLLLTFLFTYLLTSY